MVLQVQKGEEGGRDSLLTPDVETVYREADFAWRDFCHTW